VFEIVGLFTRTPARFEFPGSPDQAADRLSSLISPSIFKSWSKQSVIGKATPNRVVLYRHRPYVRNSFIPRFVGQFSIENGRTVLSGAFSLHPFTRWFMIFWLSFVSLRLLGLLTSFLTGAPLRERATAIVMTSGMALFGIALVRFGRWCARSDPAYIRAVIRAAANSESA
jgi:hypothetical protein